MRLPRGTRVVRIAVFHVRPGRRAEEISSVALAAHAGRFQATLRSRALRALRPGRYEIDATPGQSGRPARDVPRRAHGCSSA